jgi:hypothetical protein
LVLIKINIKKGIDYVCVVCIWIRIGASGAVVETVMDLGFPDYLNLC